jgi:hypothetical protein
MDTVLKSATELGVAKIVPVICRYAVSRPDASAAESWSQTLVTAMKQSGNPWLPELDVPQSFNDALTACAEDGFFGAVPREDDFQTASLPCSPSRCISSNLGNAIVSNCIMIEDVMYGVMFNANTDILENDPPVIESKKFSALSLLLLKRLANALPLMPGTGSKLPSLTTISIKNVKPIRLLKSLILKASRSV